MNVILINNIPLTLIDAATKCTTPNKTFILKLLIVLTYTTINIAVFLYYEQSSSEYE